jgi:hypothetical protein
MSTPCSAKSSRKITSGGKCGTCAEGSSRSYPGRSTELARASGLPAVGAITGNCVRVWWKSAEAIVPLRYHQCRREGPKGMSRYVFDESRETMLFEASSTVRWTTSCGGASWSMAWRFAHERNVKTRSQPSGADPHAKWCGRGPGKPGPYPYQLLCQLWDRVVCVDKEYYIGGGNV